MKAKEFIPASKPRNFVAKNAPTTGAGRHKDSNKKKDQEQGKVKHKQKQFAEDTAEAFSQAAADAKKIRDKKRGIVGHGLPWKDYTDMNELSVDVAEFVIKKGGSKWLDLKKPESVYKMIENIFVKYGYPTKIFKPVAKIVFDTLGNDYWGLKFDTTSVVKKRVFPRLENDNQNTDERVRDPEDWDEGNTEPPNNFAVYINGKKWKVFKGKGQFAGDYKQIQHHRQLQNWAQAKSAATGKEWKVFVTGETATESVGEASALEKFRKAADEREKKHSDAEKEMKARHARGEEDMKGSIDRLEKHVNNK